MQDQKMDSQSSIGNSGKIYIDDGAVKALKNEEESFTNRNY